MGWQLVAGRLAWLGLAWWLNGSVLGLVWHSQPQRPCVSLSDLQASQRCGARLEDNPTVFYRSTCHLRTYIPVYCLVSITWLDGACKHAAKAGCSVNNASNAGQGACREVCMHPGGGGRLVPVHVVAVHTTLLLSITFMCQHC
ncbi:hypothetical protein V8C86DRAFT_1603902 [Haematococcus lacustris]